MSDGRDDGPGEGPKGRKSLDEIEIRLGSLLGKLGDALDEIAGNVAAGVQTQNTAGQEPGRGPVRVQSDLRIRIGGLGVGGLGVGGLGVGGRAVGAEPDQSSGRDPARPGNPVPDPAARQPSAAPAPPREPVIEIYDEPDLWMVTAEMPGAEASTIRVIAEEGWLRMSADGARAWEARLAIPSDIEVATIEHRLANGILEVRAVRRAGLGA